MKTRSVAILTQSHLIQERAGIETAIGNPGRLHELARCLDEHTGFSEVVASLSAGHGATLEGVWGSSRALVAAALATHAQGPLVVVCPHPSDVDDFCDDLALFLPNGSDTSAETPALETNSTNWANGGEAVHRFPAWESDVDERPLHDEIYGDQLRLLKWVAAGGRPRLIVTSIQSLLQPVPGAEDLQQATRQLRVGATIDPQQLAQALVEHGFQNTSAVELPGEFSMRGGILDVFAPDWFDPVRVELFGDEIESIRHFEVATQRSLLALEAVDITLPVSSSDDREYLTAYLPEKSWFLLVEPGELEEEGRRYLDRVERPQSLHTVARVFEQVYRFPSVTAESVSAGTLDTHCHLEIESVERFSGEIGKVREELDTVGEGQEVIVVCETDAEAKRLEEIFSATQMSKDGRLHFQIGRLHSGFRLVRNRRTLVSGAELFQRTDVTRPTRRRLGRVIDSFLSLRAGDLVVHLAHGIGRYRGLTLLKKEGRVEEHLEIEFHGSTKIYVPSSKIDLVQKYVGGSKGKQSLARIGGKAWVCQKAAAEKAVIDLASEMIELQASRAARPGIGFPEDTAWQQEFDASFPYRETADQLSALAAIKRDMQESRPMDRLLCGDVGFGKTELAIRAAFKAVDSGYQVAVLVPTTVLAEQHGRTFRSRMAEFPFKIATLSRFCTKKEQRQILEQLAAGTIDIVIGTHRLAQRDVTFQNLGLVVIDEEQRFGVAVKERLKTLRATVDVLTMTATPIPRTLHLSLLGIRNISNLETAPEDRLAIETRVTRFNEELVRHAVLRELNRNGQIYYVHNRVHDIQAVAARLQRIVPEARIEIGHGQMTEGKLEDVMLRFVDRQFDILLATTIIESGLDIPNANTMFIDDADRYGLADLHQLRGRVGRYKHRAYCYFLINESRHLSPDAAKRLRAIEEFSQMGAGFAIAMRDLELRGAGNILGTQQSGHIASVGYELYCALLETVVRKLKRMPPKETVDVGIDLPGEAYLPRTYVPDMRTKIDLYRRLNRIAKDAELSDFAEELVDRFGPRPAVVDQMIALSKLRIWAHHWRIESIHMEDRYIVFRYTDRGRIEELARQSDRRLRIVDKNSAYLPMGKGVSDSEQILSEIKSLLQPRS